MGVDIDRVAGLMREAGERFVLPRFQRLADTEISTKASERDLVTVADLETEAWLGARLRELLPGSIVVGEEAVYDDESLLQRLGEDGQAWIIDPVDGTHNFVHGNPRFAIIVALVENCQTVAGWIHEPANDRLAAGERGGGVVLDGTPLRRCGTQAAKFTGNAVRHFYDRAAADPARFARVIRTNCAGHEYIRIFEGRADFSIYTKILPWDHAAGSFLIGEAGGHSARIDGTPYDPADPHGDLLNARDEATWQEIRDALTGQD